MTEPVLALPPLAALRVAFIGFGEVGSIFATALAQRGVATITAWDVKRDVAGERAALEARAAGASTTLSASAADAVREADLVLSCVTASRTREALASVAALLRPGAFYVDCNSASPGTKTACAAELARHGGRYVESAVMASVPPYGIRVPMLLGGPHVGAVLPALTELGFAASEAAAEYGVASAIKMCRSVMIKGLEALVIESFTTARRYGVEDRVLASLAETYPGIDWEEQGNYLFSRVIQHGQRRAEEMREAAVTVREAGTTPHMTAAIAERQQRVADLARAGTFAAPAGKTAWRVQADLIPREDKA